MADDVRKLVTEMYHVATAGNIEAMADLLSDDFVEHEENPGFEPNKKGTLAFFSALRSAFPDLRMQPHQVVVENDLVCSRITISGTHRGEFMGIPATNRPMSVAAIDMIRVRNGRATEHWGVTDVMAMMQQLGVMDGAGGGA